MRPGRPRPARPHRTRTQHWVGCRSDRVSGSTIYLGVK